MEMRGPQEPIVFQHAYDLTRWYADRTAGFPKQHRITLGDRLQTALFDLLSVLEDAAYGKRRPKALARAQDHVDKLRLWNRLGPRSYRPPPIKLSFLPQAEKPKRPPPKDLQKPPPEPGYERFQLRLW